MSAPVLVWLHRDLRLADNPALRAAADSGRAVVPLHVLDHETPGARRPGPAARWWLHHSLAALDADLRRCGSRLVLRRGPAAEAVLLAARATGADRVMWNRPDDPADGRVAQRVAARLAEAGVETVAFPANLLFEPGEIVSGAGRPFRVFTPFHAACQRARPPADPLPGLRALRAPGRWPGGERLGAWGLDRGVPGGLDGLWSPGERAAQARLRAFLADSLDDYARHRDRPDADVTSRLSPHLRFGEIGVRQVWHAVHAHEAAQGRRRLSDAARAFLRQIVWREFLHHLLFAAPAMTEEPLRPEFAPFPWTEDRATLAAWQRGKTGYPVVDAAMRELAETGWMHNRMRLVAGSFLVKHLLVAWQAGEAWFWERLVDADPANNAGNWQWVAGCGTDAAPYFRIFNPVRQAERFDPGGAYVRRWVPELEGLSDRYLHRPWEAPGDVLAQAGVALGRSYPRPIVDHGAARRRALDAFARIRSGRG